MDHQAEQHRAGILGSILGRQRPRSSTTNAPPNLILNAAAVPEPLPSPTGRAHSPPLPPLPPMSPANGSGHRRRTPQAPSSAQVVTNSGGFGQMLRRRRSANGVGHDGQPQREHTPPPPSAPPPAPARPVSVRPRPASSMASASAPLQPTSSGGNSQSRRIRLVPHLENARSLHFDAITRDVRPGDVPLRIGRFTDRNAGAAVTHTNNKLAFRSKVVSRGHAEIWLEGEKFYIRDTKSSSGTFLNHVRLAPPNAESRPFALKDGDLLQLGVDYQGGTEEIYRCVKMRVEVGREWQTGANAFNQNALAQLRALANTPARPPTVTTPTKGKTIASVSIEIAKTVTTPAGPAQTMSTGDCCICLFAVTVCQALFIAPCSHAFHYKCIRPLLQMHHPGFNCPLCRTFADLNADVEVEIETPPPAASTVPEVEAHASAEVVDLTMDDDMADVAEAEDEDENPAPMRSAPRRSVRRNRSAPNLADETDADIGADSDVPPPPSGVAARMPLVESDGEDAPAGGATLLHIPSPVVTSPHEAGGATLIGGLPSAALTDFGAYLAAQQFYANAPATGQNGAGSAGHASGSSRERDPDEMEVEIEMAVESDADASGGSGSGSGSGNARSASKRRRR